MTNNQKYSKLFSVLLNSQLLALKTQNYHWNVIGKDFYQLHKLFEDQYNEISGSIDEIAERIRALGFFVEPIITSHKENVINTYCNHDSSAKDMIYDLVESNQKLCTIIEKAIEVADAVTIDLLQDRLAAHQKNIWMLQSLLK